MTNDELRLYVSELAKENKLQVLRRHKPIQSYLGDTHNKLFLIVDTGLPSGECFCEHPRLPHANDKN